MSVGNRSLHRWVPVLFLFILWVALGRGLADSPDPYRLGPGDVLQITVWDHPELSQLVEVRPDGRLSFPLAGEFAATGLAPLEVSDLLATRLGAYLRSPQVTVVVKEFRTLTVQVAGQVRNPGLYKLRLGTTLAEAVSAAGGLAPDADLSRATLVSPGAGTVSLDLEGLFRRGESSANRTLADQTQLIIPELRKVTILGEVRNPGQVTVGPGDSYPELLAKAGGVTAEADFSRAALITPTGERRLLDLEGLLASGARAAAAGFDDHAQLVIAQVRKAAILGEVKNPGLVSVRKGDGYPELLAKAGGAAPEADLSRVEVAVYPAIYPAGDKAGAAIAAVDLTSTAKPAPPVEFPEDGRLVVTVPKRLRRVTLLGQVLHPGTYPLEPEAQLLEAIGAAGGPTERALLDTVRVYRGGSVDRPDQVVMGREHLLFEGSLTTGPRLQPGDVVFIPETKRVDWDKILKLLTGLTLIKDLLN